MTHQIHITIQRLHNGSATYDVYFHDTHLPALTSEDAYNLATKITNAINDHSLDCADITIKTIDGR